MWIVPGGFDEKFEDREASAPNLPEIDFLWRDIWNLVHTWRTDREIGGWEIQRQLIWAYSRAPKEKALVLFMAMFPEAAEPEIVRMSDLRSFPELAPYIMECRVWDFEDRYWHNFLAPMVATGSKYGLIMAIETDVDRDIPPDRIMSAKTEAILEQFTIEDYVAEWSLVIDFPEGAKTTEQKCKHLFTFTTDNEAAYGLIKLYYLYGDFESIFKSGIETDTGAMTTLLTRIATTSDKEDSEPILRSILNGKPEGSATDWSQLAKTRCALLLLKIGATLSAEELSRISSHPIRLPGLTEDQQRRALFEILPRLRDVDDTKWLLEAELVKKSDFKPHCLKFDEVGKQEFEGLEILGPYPYRDLPGYGKSKFHVYKIFCEPTGAPKDYPKGCAFGVVLLFISDFDHVAAIQYHHGWSSDGSGGGTKYVENGSVVAKLNKRTDLPSPHRCVTVMGKFVTTLFDGKLQVLPNETLSTELGNFYAANIAGQLIFQFAHSD